MPEMDLNDNLVEEIAVRLDLRMPNKEALKSIAYELNQHYAVEDKPPPFEGIIDAATGVGKTYIMAAALEYLAANGARNFAVIAPGRTILEKTLSNFSEGHPKSLLGGMEVKPVLVTADNFSTAAMRARMESPDEIKLFVFTVQALIKPETKAGRKTHKFHEGLGKAFYDHLKGLNDLVLFADEHHTYYGEKFSSAVRNLAPWALIGLTATPHKKTPEEQIIYRYPLSAAIADRLVKTPVIVGRRDDRADISTKLLDGVRLLQLKRTAIESWCKETGQEPVNPVMLVIAKDIDDAEKCAAVLRGPDFEKGKWADHVLVVHSSAPDEALAALERVEDPKSPVRIIISVGMLKEGWDVKNVYVIASLRSMVSELLTEQTLGRGLRLPFGQYTDWEILDTLEVLAHEKYDDLLKKAKVINESFVDYRTRAVMRKNAQGKPVVVLEKEAVELDVNADRGLVSGGTPGITDLASRTGTAKQEAASVQEVLEPAQKLPGLVIPELLMTPLESHFSVDEITDLEPFRKLGRNLAADPVAELRRVRLSAQIIESFDGLKHTQLVTGQTADRVESQAALLPLEEAKKELALKVLSSEVVPSRKTEIAAIQPILDAFYEGLGSAQEVLLSGYGDRAAALLIHLITEEQRKYAAKVKFDEVLELREFHPTRYGRPEVSKDRHGQFKKGVGYVGWNKSMYSQVWFDSSTERDFANLLDEAQEAQFWVRLHPKDLAIMWSSSGAQYNPGFVAVEKDNTHWVVETKMDKEISSEDVQGKRQAALRWANHVNADNRVKKRKETSGNILASESDLKTAKGSWPALKSLSSA